MSNGNQTPLKILLVDDMQTIRAQVRALLKDDGYQIDEAADGDEALEKIRRILPDIVLMDIVMPRMDGISCCRAIKSDPDIKHTKVIMLTETGKYGKVAEAFKAGCDDYITKPINADELTGKVKELCDYVLCRQKLHAIQERDHRGVPAKDKGSK